MELAFKYRIYPNATQRETIAKTFGCCRWVYNHTLAMRKQAYEKGEKVQHINEYIKQIPAWKKDKDTNWLKDADSMALQQSLRDLDKAYKNFFRNPGKTGFPKFKSKRNRQNYRTNNIQILDKNHVKLPKLGVVKARISRPHQGRILSATVKQTPSGKYFVTVCCTDVPLKDCAPNNTAVGIDVGIKSLLVCSDEQIFDNPKNAKKYEKKLAREQRKLSRKKKGSKNRNKQRIRVARLHEKIANSRNDNMHKATSKLASENQVVCVEDLNAKGMMSNHKLAKSVGDAAFGEIVRQLEYKCKLHAGHLQKVDRWYPSSKTCNSCGHIEDEMPLHVRKWKCPACHTEHDRDMNAAKNILAEGLRLLSNKNGSAGLAQTQTAMAV